MSRGRRRRGEGCRRRGRNILSTGAEEGAPKAISAFVRSMSSLLAGQRLFDEMGQVFRSCRCIRILRRGSGSWLVDRGCWMASRSRICKVVAQVGFKLERQCEESGELETACEARTLTRRRDDAECTAVGRVHLSIAV